MDLLTEHLTCTFHAAETGENLNASIFTIGHLFIYEIYYTLNFSHLAPKCVLLDRYVLKSVDTLTCNAQ